MLQVIKGAQLVFSKVCQGESALIESGHKKNFSEEKKNFLLGHFQSTVSNDADVIYISY